MPGFWVQAVLSLLSLLCFIVVTRYPYIQFSKVDYLDDSFQGPHPSTYLSLPAFGAFHWLTIIVPKVKGERLK